MYLALLSTDIVSLRDLERITPEMNELIAPCTWSVDLGDEDKILRIQLSSNSIGVVRTLLRKYGFSSELLNIYHLEYGIDFPLIPGERRIPEPSFVSFSLAMAFFTNTGHYTAPFEWMKPAV
ncbi:MAG TPA: hypothetical protein VL092_00145 [Chitinophagaceae bacterium]|nr:hypothetical protein [Chitinophagaceae bacterium]